MNLSIKKHRVMRLFNSKRLKENRTTRDIVINMLLGGRLTFYSPSCACNLIYMGFISAGAYTLWDVLLKHNPVSRVSIFGFINPVMGVMLSALFLGENKEAFSLNGLAALLLVALGIIIVNTGAKEQQ